jgi:hypothetical protein
VNLITDVIEEIYPADDVPSVQLEEQQSLSVEEMIRREVEAAKGGTRSSKDKSFSQKAVSILTDVKGIVIIKLSKRKYCPVKILSHIIEKIEHDRIPLTRYVVRLIPLQVTFFPKQDELADNIPYLLHSHLSGIELPQKRKKGENGEGDNEDDSVSADEEDNANALPQHNEDVNTRTNEGNAAKKQRVDESGNAVVVSLEEPTVAIESATEISEPTATAQKIRYSIEYKGRNHNVLNREMVYVMFNQRLRDYGVVDYRNPEVSFEQSSSILWIVLYFSLHLARNKKCQC